MNETIRDPLKRPVPRKQALLALGVVLVLLAGLLLASSTQGGSPFSASARLRKHVSSYFSASLAKRGRGCSRS